MAWIILGIAVITEIAWALSMKWAATNGTWTGASVAIIQSPPQLLSIIHIESADRLARAARIAQVQFQVAPTMS